MKAFQAVSKVFKKKEQQEDEDILGSTADSGIQDDQNADEDVFEIDFSAQPVAPQVDSVEEETEVVSSQKLEEMSVEIEPVVEQKVENVQILEEKESEEAVSEELESEESITSTDDEAAFDLELASDPVPVSDSKEVEEVAETVPVEAEIEEKVEDEEITGQKKSKAGVKLFGFLGKKKKLSEEIEGEPEEVLEEKIEEVATEISPESSSEIEEDLFELSAVEQPVSEPVIKNDQANASEIESVEAETVVVPKDQVEIPEEVILEPKSEPMAVIEEKIEEKAVELEVEHTPQTEEKPVEEESKKPGKLLGLFGKKKKASIEPQLDEEEIEEVATSSESSVTEVEQETQTESSDKVEEDEDIFELSVELPPEEEMVPEAPSVEAQSLTVTAQEEKAVEVPDPVFGKIAHVCLNVKDLNRSIEYYTRLGFKKKFFFHKNEKLYGVYLEFGSGNFIELFEDSNLDLSAPAGRLAHFCLETDNIDEVMKSLSARGIEFTEKKLGCDNTYQIWLKDPDGNAFEVHQYTDKSSQFTKQDVEVDW